MVADGIRIAKFFLHITPVEQARRFKDRITNPLKRWKLSYEDFRNRSRWADYEIAIEDMLENTSSLSAPLASSVSTIWRLRSLRSLSTTAMGSLRRIWFR